jgi:hypothetical protein
MLFRRPAEGRCDAVVDVNVERRNMQSVTETVINSHQLRNAMHKRFHGSCPFRRSTIALCGLILSQYMLTLEGCDVSSTSSREDAVATVKEEIEDHFDRKQLWKAKYLFSGSRRVRITIYFRSLTVLQASTNVWRDRC